MNLTFDEGKLFYDLYAALLSFVNRKLKVSPERFSDSQEYATTPPEARVAIRDALFDHRERVHHGRAARTEGGSGNGLREGADSVHSSRAWRSRVR